MVCYVRTYLTVGADLARSHLTSLHLAPPRSTSLHLASPRLTSPHPAPPRHISPQALTSPHAASYLAPVALWLYMLTVQLGMLNLLIAIMTDTYFKVVQGAAVAKWRLARVSMTNEYLERPAVPAPLDLPIFLSKLFPSTSTLLVNAASKVDLIAVWIRARELFNHYCACCARAVRRSPEASPEGSPVRGGAASKFAALGGAIPGSPAPGMRSSGMSMFGVARACTSKFMKKSTNGNLKRSVIRRKVRQLLH